MVADVADEFGIKFPRILRFCKVTDDGTQYEDDQQTN